jgi:hypothetical protein
LQIIYAIQRRAYIQKHVLLMPPCSRRRAVVIRVAGASSGFNGSSPYAILIDIIVNSRFDELDNLYI